MFGIVSAQEDLFHKVPDLESVINDEHLLLEDRERKPIDLTLEDCIAATLQHNYSVKAGGFDPAIRLSDIVQAEAVFDAVLYGSVQLNHNESYNIDTTYYTRTKDNNGDVTVEKIPTDLFNSNSDDNYTLGLRKLIPSGGVVQLAQSLRRYQDHIEEGLYQNPFYESAIQVQYRQPLLRDFGVDVNRAGILAARNRYKTSLQQFQLLVINSMTEAESTYWNLFSARQQVKIQQELLNRAERTLLMVQARVNYDGRSISLARTQAVIAKAKADLLTAQNSVLQMQDRLLRLMNDPEMDLNSNIELILFDKPCREHYYVDREKAIETALKIRPEVVAQQLTVDTAGLALGVARNQKLPRLDLVFQHEVSGAEGTSSSSVEEMWEGKAQSYAVGLSFETPFGNRASTAAFERARKQYQQEMVRLKSVEQDVQTELSISLHNLEKAWEETQARLEAVEYDRNEVLNFLALLDTERQDTVTPEFLNIKLNADQRLAYSQAAALQAMVQYDLAIMNLQKAQGALLRYNNVKLAEQADSE